jgi:hypothetical protein
MAAHRGEGTAHGLEHDGLLDGLVAVEDLRRMPLRASPGGVGLREEDAAHRANAGRRAAARRQAGTHPSFAVFLRCAVRTTVVGGGEGVKSQDNEREAACELVAVAAGFAVVSHTHRWVVVGECSRSRRRKESTWGEERVGGRQAFGVNKTSVKRTVLFSLFSLLSLLLLATEGVFILPPLVWLPQKRRRGWGNLGSSVECEAEMSAVVTYNVASGHQMCPLSRSPATRIGQ